MCQSKSAAMYVAVFTKLRIHVQYYYSNSYDREGGKEDWWCDEYDHELEFH